MTQQHTHHYHRAVRDVTHRYRISARYVFASVIFVLLVAVAESRGIFN